MIKHIKHLKSIYQFSTNNLEESSAEKYVEEKLRSRNWSTFILHDYYPSSVRGSFRAINLYALELAKISDNLKQPSLALGRLQFWRTIINKIYSSEEINNQPISICIRKACQTNPLTKGYFSRLISAYSQQISCRNFDNFSQLLRLAEQTQAPILSLQLQLLRIQIDNEPLTQIITQLSRSLGLCYYIKRIPYGLRNNRFFIPLQLLSKYNLNTGNIWNRVHGKPSEQLFDAILQIAAYARNCLIEAKRIYKQNQKYLSEKHSQCFRAFLAGVQLQIFNVFEKGLNSNYPLKLPYRIYSAARKKTFFLSP